MRRARSARAAALAATLLALAAAAGPAAAGADLDSRLQTALAAGVEQWRVPGAVALVSSADGVLWQGAAGAAELSDRAAMTSDLHFHIGSLTKSFTATLFLMLADQGLVSLDDTLGQRLPGLVAGADDVTMRDLLGMRSGLTHYEESPVFGENFLARPRRQWSAAELAALCHGGQAEPGAVFDYNNLNYVLIGEVIQRALGQDWQDAMADMIFTPLGLAHTSAPRNADMPARYAHGYLADHYQATDYSTHWDPSVFGSAGSIISTAADVMTWFQALMSGSLLSQTAHAEQFDMTPMEGQADAGYGLGVGEKDGLVGHTGNYNGLYTAAMYRYQSWDIVVLCNGRFIAGDEDSKASNLLQGLLPVLESTRP